MATDEPEEPLLVSPTALAAAVVGSIPGAVLTWFADAMQKREPYGPIAWGFVVVVSSLVGSVAYGVTLQGDPSREARAMILAVGAAFFSSIAGFVLFLFWLG